MKKNDKFILEFFIILLVVKVMLQNSLYVTIPEFWELGIEVACYIYFFVIIIKYLKIKKWKITLIFFIVILAFYTGYITEDMTLLSSIMFMTVAAIIRDREIIKLSNKVMGIILFIHISIYFVQMIIGSVIVNPDSSGRTRYLLGFSHPNTSGIFILWWAVGKVYLANYNMKKVFIYFVIIIIAYYFNRCRSMLYCGIILMILSICINRNIGTREIKFLAKNIIIIMSIMIVSIVFLYNSNNKQAKELDQIFSNRIFFSAQAINENGFTLIGQKVKQSIVKIGNYVGYIVMDVTYTALFYRFGIVYLVLLILLSRYIVKTQTKNEYVLLIVYGIFAMLELYSLNFIICFPMIFGANWIGEKNDT